MARSRGKDTATTRLRLAGMFTSITVSDRVPPASSVSPAPMSLFSPNRLSTPTIRKFSSPYCALGSTMSREPRSSAETLLSMLFFDDCHCQAPPVRANAETAIRAAAARPAIMVFLRRPRRGSGSAVLRPVPTRDGCTRSPRRSAASSGTSEAYPATTGITSVSGSSGSAGAAEMISVAGVAGGSGSGRGRLSSSGTLEAPCTLAIRSATVTPLVWLPVCADCSASPELATAVALPRRGAWRWPRVRVSHWLSPPMCDGPAPGRPGVALSPSLMFLVASDFWTIVRVGAHGRMQRLCLLLGLVAALCRLRRWSRIRQGSYRTETS